jgi:multisubunit Na+/H+ antiporter MnhC subunit
MKSKQLANVLIKILGLSVLVHGIPSILTGLANLIQARGVGSHGDFFWLYPLTSVVLVAIGIYLIVKSRDVTALLFKDENE